MTIAEELKLIAVRHRWAYEELVYSEHQIAWNKLCFKVSNKYEELLYSRFMCQAATVCERVESMFQYLQEQYGGTTQVLIEIRALLSVQRERRKTICPAD